MTEFRKVPLDQIRPSPFQIRVAMDPVALDQLAESLERDGQQRPVKLRPVQGGYEIVFGHRTVEAAKRKNWASIDAVIEELSDEQVIWAQYAENEYREEISDYDRARWLRNMIERFQYTQQQLGEKIGKTQPVIANHLRMLELEPIISREIILKMTEGLARAILEAPDDVRQTLIQNVEAWYIDQRRLPTISTVRDMTVMLESQLSWERKLPKEEFEEEKEELTVPMGMPEPDAAKPEAPSTVQEERAPATIEPRRTVISAETPKELTGEIERVSDRYPAAADYVADYFSKNFRPDEPFLRWSLIRKFGISEAEAAGLVSEYKRAPRPLAPKIVPKPEGTDVAEFKCPVCGYFARIVHVNEETHKFVKIIHAEADQP